MPRLAYHCRKSLKALTDPRHLCQGSTIILWMCALSLVTIAIAILISRLIEIV